MAHTIDIPAEPVEKITVNLVGKKYLLTPPKAALSLRIARRAQDAQGAQDADPLKMLDVLREWLTLALGAAQAKAVMKRLDDPDDALDFRHVMVLLEKVVEAQTANPTS